MEILCYNEKIIHKTHDRLEDYEANIFEVHFNKGRIIFVDGCPMYHQADIELRYYTDKPLDCFYIGADSKKRVEIPAQNIDLMGEKLRKLVMCLVDKKNPYAQGFRGRDCEEACFHFPSNQRQIEWKACTEPLGGTPNHHDFIFMKFSINADYDYCENCLNAK